MKQIRYISINIIISILIIIGLTGCIEQLKFNLAKKSTTPYYTIKNSKISDKDIINGILNEISLQLQKEYVKKLPNYSEECKKSYSLLVRASRLSPYISKPKDNFIQTCLHKKKNKYLSQYNKKILTDTKKFNNSIIESIYLETTYKKTSFLPNRKITTKLGQIRIETLENNDIILYLYEINKFKSDHNRIKNAIDKYILQNKL